MANLFDAANAPLTEPDEFTVGDFVQWKRTDFVSDYPTAEYSAQYVARLHQGGSAEFVVSATEDPDAKISVQGRSSNSTISTVINRAGTTLVSGSSLLNVTARSGDLTLDQVSGTSEYLFTISSSTSASITPGLYHWQLEITQTATSNRIVYANGDFNILVDLDVNNADPRIHAEIMVAKIESLLSGKADDDVSSYSIAGRSLTKLSFAELTEARDYYRREVVEHTNRERIKRGKKGNETIKVRF